MKNNDINNLPKQRISTEMLEQFLDAIHNEDVEYAKSTFEIADPETKK